MPLEGLIAPSKQDVAKYAKLGCWLNITLADVLDRAAEQCPDKEALVDDRSRLTYAGLRKTVARLAGALMRLGINRGDCVLLQLPNWNEFVAAFFALHKIGAPAVLLLPRHRQIEINHFCGLTGAKAWIVPERHRNTEYAPISADVRKSNPGMERVISVRAKDETPFVRFESLMQ